MHSPGLGRLTVEEEEQFKLSHGTVSHLFLPISSMA